MGCVFDNPKCSTEVYINEEESKKDKDFTNFFNTANINQNQMSKDKETTELAKSNKIMIIKPEADFIHSSRKSNGDLSQRQSVLSLQDELISSPKLKLFVYSNQTSSLVNIIVLTPNSLKTQTQAITKFKTPHKFSFGKDSKNDCVINDDSLGKFQFHINFLYQKFYIIDNLNGTGLFIKITNYLLIDHDVIVSFGADHMYIQSKKNEDGKDIKVKFCQNKSIQCNYSSSQKKVITIGRNKKCDVYYQEDSVSKVQCTLIYNDNDNDWMLYDGSMNHNEQRCSTNGLWYINYNLLYDINRLLANKSIELTDKMSLKTGGLKMTVVLDQLNSSSNEEDIQINHQRLTNDGY